MLSSDLIKAAVAATIVVWEPPDLGMVTFVNAAKVRRKRDPGRCFRRAGFLPVGETKGGLLAFQLLPGVMPEPCPAAARQGDMFIAAPARAVDPDQPLPIGGILPR